MATHSSVLAWRIPGMGKPGGLPSMGSHRIRHDWSDLAAATENPGIYRSTFKVLRYVDFPGGPSGKEPACQKRQETKETWFQSLGWEDALEEGMATHSRMLACGMLWTEEPGRLQSIGSQRVGYDWSNLAHRHIEICIAIEISNLNMQSESYSSFGSLKIMNSLVDEYI